MGQKVNPVGFRINLNNNWSSVWYDDRNYRENLIKDLQIQNYIEKNFKNFSIIHGKGNGILQSAVWDYLKNYPGIASFQFASPEDGGTGKTYVYIKSIFELNERYGWSKFIIVVPSIAIREGVKKSFEMMSDHFMEK